MTPYVELTKLQLLRRRPRLVLSDHYFVASYKADTAALYELARLLTDVVSLQRANDELFSTRAAEVCLIREQSVTCCAWFSDRIVFPTVHRLASLRCLE